MGGGGWVCADEAPYCSPVGRGERLAVEVDLRGRGGGLGLIRTGVGLGRAPAAGLLAAGPVRFAVRLRRAGDAVEARGWAVCSVPSAIGRGGAVAADSDAGGDGDGEGSAGSGAGGRGCGYWVQQGAAGHRQMVRVKPVQVGLRRNAKIHG